MHCNDKELQSKSFKDFCKAYNINSNNKKILQEFLGITTDGDFGPGTEKAVKTWQTNNGLLSDGIVGPKTWKAMGLDERVTTDNSERVIELPDGLIIEEYFLPKGE